VGRVISKTERKKNGVQEKFLIKVSKKRVMMENLRIPTKNENLEDLRYHYILRETPTVLWSKSSTCSFQHTVWLQVELVL